MCKYIYIYIYIALPPHGGKHTDDTVRKREREASYGITETHQYATLLRGSRRFRGGVKLRIGRARLTPDLHPSPIGISRGPLF